MNRLLATAMATIAATAAVVTVTPAALAEIVIIESDRGRANFVSSGRRFGRRGFSRSRFVGRRRVFISPRFGRRRVFLQRRSVGRFGRFGRRSGRRFR